MNIRDMVMPLEEGSKVWINFIPYAERLFSAGRDDLWNNSDTFISVYSQGQGLIRSDVLSIPAGDVYMDLIQREEELFQPWMGKKPTFSLKKLLALEEPRGFLTDVLTALQNLYRGDLPVVLVVPSPQTILQILHEKVRPDQEVTIQEHDIEAASMYLAEYLRKFSTLGLSAIVIKEEEPAYGKLSETLSLYEPILNIAQHYQWSVGMELQGPAKEIKDCEDKVDFYLFGTSDLNSLFPLWQKGIASGGGLNTEFWTETSNGIERTPTGLIYGEIPKDANPEGVLARLQELRT
ncbi:hypothetical protein [Bacillus piscicola]|uniref:hypothetical protein n=1 Tax=Bacillus piscicola TaxID=1632684 RepID=UPI001F09FB15|nr:hypothetical protein [Bacillus piscicola]